MRSSFSCTASSVGFTHRPLICRRLGAAPLAELEISQPAQRLTSTHATRTADVRARVPVSAPRGCRSTGDGYLRNFVDRRTQRTVVCRWLYMRHSLFIGGAWLCLSYVPYVSLTCPLHVPCPLRVPYVSQFVCPHPLSSYVPCMSLVCPLYVTSYVPCMSLHFYESQIHWDIRSTPLG